MKTDVKERKKNIPSVLLEGVRLAARLRIRVHAVVGVLGSWAVAGAVGHSGRRHAE